MENKSCFEAHTKAYIHEADMPAPASNITYKSTGSCNYINFQKYLVIHYVTSIPNLIDIVINDT